MTYIQQLFQGLDNLLSHFLTGLSKKQIFKEPAKVRYTKGLLVHLFGKIASAFISLIF